MSPEKESKYVGWTWIVSVLIGLLMLIGGYVLNDTRASICRLEEGKLDRKEYVKDYQKRNEDVNLIITKIDHLSDLMIRHLQREGNRK